MERIEIIKIAEGKYHILKVLGKGRKEPYKRANLEEATNLAYSGKFEVYMDESVANEIGKQMRKQQETGLEKITESKTI
jgi:hypothetical protein